MLVLGVTKDNAKARFLARGRDTGDGEEKFERRFAEYESESRVVEEVYRERGIVIDVSTTDVVVWVDEG